LRRTGTEKRRRGSSTSPARRERGLLTDVIEVQHPRVTFAAVDARVLSEERGDEPPGRDDTPAPGRGALAAVQVPTAPEVRAEARAAPVLEPVARAVELAHGLLETAASASFQFPSVHEHMFANASDRKQV
jgi:hypothetical protein